MCAKHCYRRWRLKSLLPVVLLALTPLLLPGQSPCYEKLRREGLDQLRLRHYAEAFNDFWAAFVSCPDKPADNDLSALILQAQEAWVKELEGLVKREKEAYTQAVAAKEDAEQARQNESQARQLAEENARRAKEQGLRAETLRLALLADLMRGKGNRSDALLLAWLALQLAGPETTPYLQHAFYEAVRDSFATGIFSGPQTVENLDWLPGNDGVAIRQAGAGLLWVQGGANGQVVRQFGPDTEGLIADAKGDAVLSWAGANTAQLWTAAGQPGPTLEGHSEGIRFAAFSPDGQYVVTCSRDNTARLWTAAGQLVATLNGHSGNVYFAEFSPDHSTLLTRASDGTACTWDITGARLASFPADPGGGYLLDARLCGSGNRVVSLDAGGQVELWDARGQAIARLGDAAQPARAIDLTAGGARVLLRTAGTEAALYAAADGRKLAAYAHPAQVEGLQADAAGTRVLSWAADHTVRLWDDRGQLLQAFVGHRDAVIDACLSPDQTLVLTTAQDGTVKLWGAKGNILIDWPVASRQPLPARFSPDGQFILVSEKDNTRISRLPLPQQVYESYSRTIDRNGAALSDLAAEHHIQFLDSLPK